jgi:glycosyltransferase involved in cell wall biosynthesis
MTKPLKLSIIGVKGYPYVYGGYETLIKELAERISKKNIEVTIYCHKSLFKERPNNLDKIKLVYMPCIETKALSQLTHSFLSTIHVCFSKADVVFYVNAANGPFGYLTKLFKKKTVINVDGLEWLRPKWKGWGAKYYYFAAKKATKLFNVLVTDAFEMQKIYKQLFNANSTMIAYGTDAFITQPVTFLEQWNLKEQDYYLIVGRLIPDNNSDLLIDAFLNFNSKKKLLIVGDDVFNNAFSIQIKNKIKASSNIIFTGYIKDTNLLSALYQHAFAYLHGHEFGGTNPTLVKAMGEGSLILALNNKFNSEVLKAGEYGHLFEKNIESLTQLMMASEKEDDATQLRVKTMRSNSTKGLVERYQWDYIIDQYYQIFINL